jgi:hypothetical protein
LYSGAGAIDKNRPIRQNGITPEPFVQSAATKRSAMDAAQMYRTYERHARAAVDPTMRTVNMLGMMCAAAIAQGGFFAFVGKGYGGNWPNPCMQGNDVAAYGASKTDRRG